MTGIHMDLQQGIALAIVACAALYLGRCLMVSARNFFSKQGGCAGGCGKCSFAPRNHAEAPSRKTPTNIAIIPLMEVRSGAVSRQDPHKEVNRSI